MIIFPAIDLKNGKVVRLRQGKFDDVTEYALEPIQAAEDWVRAGAKWLHIVDLDGALEGTMKNLPAIRDIVQNVKIPVQIGGGIRLLNEVETLLSMGVQRVIFGTRVISDRAFLQNALKLGKEKIAVSLDCKDGKITQRGWTETTEKLGTEFAQELEQEGLQCLIYTDIKRDGMLTGPNLQALSEILATVRMPIIASGGISNIEDVKKLIHIQPRKLLGAITGRALYEGTLNLTEAIQLCSQAT